MIKMLLLCKMNLTNQFSTIPFAYVKRGFDEKSFQVVFHLLDRKKGEIYRENYIRWDAVLFLCSFYALRLPVPVTKRRRVFFYLLERSQRI